MTTYLDLLLNCATPGVAETGDVIAGAAFRVAIYPLTVGSCSTTSYVAVDWTDGKGFNLDERHNEAKWWSLLHVEHFFIISFEL